VGLQEVWATGEENLAGWLADRLGMQWTWSASPAPERWQQRIGDPTTQFGDAILSRFPTTDRAMEVLPPDDRSDTSAHTVLHARFQAPRGVIPFFTTADLDGRRIGRPLPPGRGTVQVRRFPHVRQVPARVIP
jgi:endonuclease/exonuclease/phosphatase family metal-dependent hydrolase